MAKQNKKTKFYPCEIKPACKQEYFPVFSLNLIPLILDGAWKSFSKYFYHSFVDGQIGFGYFYDIQNVIFIDRFFPF